MDTALYWICGAASRRACHSAGEHTKVVISLLTGVCGIFESVLYWQGMDAGLSAEQLEQVREWLGRVVLNLRRTGMGLDSLLDILIETPLGFIAAQTLLIAQPVLSQLVERGVHESLARLLSTAEGTAWLREQLISLERKDVGR